MPTIRTINDLNDTIQQQQEAIKQMERSIAAMEKSHRPVRLRAIAPGNQDASRAFCDDDEARAFGLYVLANHLDPATRASAENAIRSAPGGVFTRDMSSTTGASGGALVPTTLYPRVKELLEKGGVFFRNAFRLPMATGQMTFLKQIGELGVYSPGENTAPTKTDLNFQSVNLNEKEWCTLTLYPRSLGEDSVVEIAELIALAVFRAMAIKADQVAFNGDGSSTYFNITGIIPKLINRFGAGGTTGGLVAGTGVAGAGWNSLAIGDFEDMQSRLPDYPGIEPKWYCTRRFYHKIMTKIANAAGGATAAEINGMGRRERMFLGDPVEFVSVMPKTSGDSQIPVLYGDMRQCATWGDRRSSTVEESRDYKFAERQVTVLGSMRVAISIEDIHHPGDESEPGPMVGLITPAAA
jgi:HK97 family phage major capsid protein